MSACEIDLEAHRLVVALEDVDPVETRFQHGTAILESKVFRNADVITVGEYLRSWRMNIKNEPRGERLLDDDRRDGRLSDNFALDDDFSLDDNRHSIWNEHEVRSAVRASIPILASGKLRRNVIGPGD